VHDLHFDRGTPGQDPGQQKSHRTRWLFYCRIALSADLPLARSLVPLQCRDCSEWLQPDPNFDMNVQALLGILHKLTLRPIQLQAVVNQHAESLALKDFYTGDSPTLPMGSEG